MSPQLIEKLEQQRNTPAIYEPNTQVHGLSITGLLDVTKTAEIYAAQSPEDGAVALKVLSSPSKLPALEHEASMHSRVANDPHVVDIVEYNPTAEHPYLVTKLQENGTLGDFVFANRPSVTDNPFDYAIEQLGGDPSPVIDLLPTSEGYLSDLKSLISDGRILDLITECSLIIRQSDGCDVDDVLEVVTQRAWHSGYRLCRGESVIERVAAHLLKLAPQRISDMVPDKDLTRQYAEILSGAIQGIEGVHSSGIVAMRDVKPGNICLDRMLTPRHIDFEAAVDKELKGLDRNIGTIGYMPLEAYVGDVNGTFDQYSIAASIYYCMTGGSRLPVEVVSNDHYASFLATRDTKPVHISELNSHIPRNVGDVIMSALSNNIAKRATLEHQRQALNTLIAS